MKDLWQALRADGGFISLLSTKSPPLRRNTYLLCSALSLLCVPTHSLSRSVLTPTTITIRNLTMTNQPYLLPYTLLPLLQYLPTSHLSPLLPARLFDFVSLAQSTLLPLFFYSSFLSLCFIALATSLHPSLLSLATGVFSVYFAYAVCFPPTVSGSCTIPWSPSS